MTAAAIYHPQKYHGKLHVFGLRVRVLATCLRSLYFGQRSVPGARKPEPE